MEEPATGPGAAPTLEELGLDVWILVAAAPWLAPRDVVSLAAASRGCRELAHGLRVCVPCLCCTPAVLEAGLAAWPRLSVERWEAAGALPGGVGLAALARRALAPRGIGLGTPIPVTPVQPLDPDSGLAAFSGLPSVWVTVEAGAGAVAVDFGPLAPALRELTLSLNGPGALAAPLRSLDRLRNLKALEVVDTGSTSGATEAPPDAAANLEAALGEVPPTLETLKLLGVPALHRVPPPVAALSGLRTLILGSLEGLAGIGEGVLGGLAQLTRLEVHLCRLLASLPSDLPGALVHVVVDGCPALAAVPALGHCTALAELHLRHLRRVPALPDMFGGLPRLCVVEVSSLPRLAALPPSLLNAPSLAELDAGRCSGLRALAGEGACFLPSLATLCLADCGSLGSLPADLAASCPALECLDLTRCSVLRSLPACVGLLPRLRELCVGECGLAALPLSIGQLPLLERLTCSGPALAGVPPSLGALANLCSLELHGAMPTLPGTLCDLSRLEHLDLGHSSSLAGLPAGLGRLRALRTINLSYNMQLRSLPASLGELARLEVLNMTHCTSLRALPGSIARLAALRILDLSFCISLGGDALDAIRPLLAPRRLLSLDLNGCCFQAV